MWTALLAALLGIVGIPGRLPLQADDHDDTAPLEVGYAVVTPIPDTAVGLSVFENFGLQRPDGIDATTVVPEGLTTAVSMFATRSALLDRNLGLAITNPNQQEARIDLTLRGGNGLLMAQQTIFLPGRRQRSEYVSQIFSGIAGWVPEFEGTLALRSTQPVAVLALRTRGAGFTALPLSGSMGGTVPLFSTGVGGPNAVLLPHFAAGSGWATEILVVNSAPSWLGVRLDFFKPDGSPMSVRLNGTSGSTFLYPNTLQPNGIMTFAPREPNGASRF